MEEYVIPFRYSLRYGPPEMELLHRRVLGFVHDVGHERISVLLRPQGSIAGAGETAVSPKLVAGLD
jgi:hypothetical protein